MDRTALDRIINVTALDAQSGAMNMTFYTASKGGVVAFGRSLAVVVMNSCFLLDDIDYADDVIPFGDAKRAVSAKTGYGSRDRVSR